MAAGEEGLLKTLAAYPLLPPLSVCFEDPLR